MRIIKSDPGRRIMLEGVSRPVLRPVDIDASQTGFTALRTLRVYRFEAGDVIEGHAEEDEVFIVALAGGIELSMRADDEPERRLRLDAPAPATHEAPVRACVAYLPRHGEYVLTAVTETDVAYVRATPQAARPLASFAPSIAGCAGPLASILRIDAHAERLRLQLLCGQSGNGTSRAPLELGAPSGETLLHLHGSSQSFVHLTADGQRQRLDPGETAALTVREGLRLESSGAAQALIVSAV